MLFRTSTIKMVWVGQAAFTIVPTISRNYSDIVTKFVQLFLATLQTDDRDLDLVFFNREILSSEGKKSSIRVYSHQVIFVEDVISAQVQDEGPQSRNVIHAVDDSCGQKWFFGVAAIFLISGESPWVRIKEMRRIEDNVF